MRSNFFKYSEWNTTQRLKQLKNVIKDEWGRGKKEKKYAEDVW